MKSLLLALGACLAFSGLWCRPAMACGSTAFTVGSNLNALPTPTFNADESYKRYAVGCSACRGTAPTAAGTCAHSSSKIVVCC
jgi:hypothetical protein